MKLYELMDPNWKCVQCDFGPVLPLINLLDALKFLISWNLYNKTCVWGPAYTRPAQLLTPPRSLTCWYSFCLVLFPQINQSPQKKPDNFLKSSMFGIFLLLPIEAKNLLPKTFTNTWKTSIPPWVLSFQFEFVNKFKLMDTLLLLLFCPYWMQPNSVGDWLDLITRRHMWDFCHE